MDIPNLRRKADSDNAVAQSILGNCYLDGAEVGVDDEEAFRLLYRRLPARELRGPKRT
jgi:TPR repeat protein